MSDLGNKKIFSENLKYYMELKNISRNQLIKKVNLRFPDNQIRYSTLSDWLNARTYPRIDKIEALSRVFNINKSDLVEDRQKEQESTLNIQYSQDFHELEEEEKREVEKQTQDIFNALILQKKQEKLDRLNKKKEVDNED